MSVEAATLRLSLAASLVPALARSTAPDSAVPVLLREALRRRKLPLKASETHLSTGFPGRLTSRCPWFQQAPWSIA